MKKWFRLLGMVLITGLLVGISLSVVVFGQDMVNISPQTLNLDEFGAGEITVHVSIDFEAEDCVEMKTDYGDDTIEASRTFADDRGDLVAKFSLEDVASILEEEEGEITLILLVDNTEIGSDDIEVISGGIKKGNGQPSVINKKRVKVINR